MRLRLTWNGIKIASDVVLATVMWKIDLTIFNMKTLSKLTYCSKVVLKHMKQYLTVLKILV